MSYHQWSQSPIWKEEVEFVCEQFSQLHRTCSDPLAFVDVDACEWLVHWPSLWPEYWLYWWFCALCLGDWCYNLDTGLKTFLCSSIQFSFINISPSHNRGYLRAILTIHLSYYLKRTNIPPLAWWQRQQKTPFLTGRNLEENLAHGGWPSASTGWVYRGEEGRRERVSGRQKRERK